MIKHIQVNAVGPSVHYDADGVQTAFTFPFAVFKAADLQVWVDKAQVVAGFSLSGVGVSSGGAVLFAVPPAPGCRVTLRRRVALERTTDFQTDGIIRAKTLNDELDYQVAAVQQVAEDVSRCLSRPFTSTSTADLSLPDPLPGKAIGWNADGSGLVNDPADFAATVAAVTTDAAAAAAARVGVDAAVSATAVDRAAVAADRAAVATALAATAGHRAAADVAAAAAVAAQTGAADSRTAAATSASAATASRNAASVSAQAAAMARDQAVASRDTAVAAAAAASSSEQAALNCKNAAATSAQAAQTYASQAQAASNIQTFSTVAVPGQPAITAGSAGDTLTITAGANIALSANGASDTLTVAVTGLAPVAVSGKYADLSGRPSLGTAAAATIGTGAGQLPTADQVPGLVQGVPTGVVVPHAGLAPPPGWLTCDGSAVSRTTYAALFAALVKSAAVTITIAAPGVIAWSSHGLSNGQAIVLRTTGALPTGLAAGATYYVVNAATNSFQLAASAGGSAINLSGSQSGTHTANAAAFGDGDGSTTFTLPDLRGRAAIGAGTGVGLSARVPGARIGAETHTLSVSEMPSHTHSGGSGGSTMATSSEYNFGVATPGSTGSQGGGGAHNNMPPSIALNFIIKT